MESADVVVDFVGVDATIALATAVARPLSDITVVGIGGDSVPFGFFSVPCEARLATTYWGRGPSSWRCSTWPARDESKPWCTDSRSFTLDEAPTVYERLAPASSPAGR